MTTTHTPVKRMTRREQYAQHRAYIERECLNRLIDFTELDRELGVSEAVQGNMRAPIPPQPADLVHLHRRIRERKSFTVLEFGVGYSTLVIADALEKNERDWSALDLVPTVRNRHPFHLFSVDASQQWISHVQQQLPTPLRHRVHLQHSAVEIGTFQGWLCHYYAQLPDIVPDFIYLDGPDPKDVQGNVRGLSFQCDERTVMAADPLLMEPTFLPGTFIVVDGRTNNVRFLQRNFQRTYEVTWDRELDVTTFELREERLGKHNVLGSDFFPHST